jgi:hypothetical protein
MLIKGAQNVAKANVMFMLFFVFGNAIMSYHGLLVVDMKSTFCSNLSDLVE